MKQIKIGGNRYTIKFVPSEELGGDSGECNTAKLEIRLSKDSIAEALPPTIWHEILHAINIALEETSIEFLAQAIHQVLKENPQLVALYSKRGRK